MGSLCNDSSSFLAGPGPKIDDPVSCFDKINIVFDDKHSVFSVDKLMEHVKKAGKIMKMKACCRLVKDVESFSCSRPCKLFCYFEPLCFASGECCGRLSKL